MQQQESLVVHQAVIIYQGFQAHAIRNFPQNRLIFSSSTLWEETSDFASRAVWEAAEKFLQGLASFSVTQLVPSLCPRQFVMDHVVEKKPKTNLSGSVEFGLSKAQSNGR